MDTFHLYAQSFMFACFFLVMLSLFLKSTAASIQDKAKIHIGICQPYLKNKWSPENVSDHKNTLIKQTTILASLSPDLIVWPEASTPYPVNLDRLWIEKLSQDIEIPILAEVRLSGKKN